MVSRLKRWLRRPRIAVNVINTWRSNRQLRRWGIAISATKACVNGDILWMIFYPDRSVCLSVFGVRLLRGYGWHKSQPKPRDARFGHLPNALEEK